MKGRLLFAFIITLCIHEHSSAQELEPHDMFVLGRYITDHQFTIDSTDASGAIWVFAYPDTLNADSVYKVIPYYAHYACRGLLKCSTPAENAAVKNWMKWYLAHVDSAGRSVNHYYNNANTSDSIADANENDAQDAEPALFWELADEYYTATSDKSLFTTSAKWKLENSAKFIIENLMDADHLTYANINYAMKYTVDNSEVYQGFMALAAIEKDIYHDNAGYSIYKAKAGMVKDAIKLRLYDPVSGLYMNNANNKTNVKNWYDMGMVPTLWPQLCGVETCDADHSAHQREVLCQNFNDKNGKDWETVDFIKNGIDSFPNAAVGYVFSMAGDIRGHHQLSYVVQLFKDPLMANHCNIEEAGLGIMHLSTVFKKQ